MHCLRETVRSVKGLGLDGVSFLAADVTSEAFNRAGTWPDDRQSEVALSAGEILVLEEEVEQLIAEFADEIDGGYIAESPAKLRRIVASFKARLGQVKAESPRCNAPWVSAVVEADGSVRPCFFHPAVGNIGDASSGRSCQWSKGTSFSTRAERRKQSDLPTMRVLALPFASQPVSQYWSGCSLHKRKSNDGYDPGYR